ncbi:DegV family protein [Alkalicoccus daliensis]|uniref:EDD domain protein, DegV family n=1 Tax=Alkalicoccus daliensis TaxID=745820 RepID=A0A1H0AQ35_9BACI|nr:DegV family protein [Alkalicoccus daliensis]SDN35454.1 EDD domain protein, DegV family [Alkalicoccus daliensis]
MAEQVKIVTDSTVDLPKEQLAKMGVTVVPLTVTIEGESYLDGIDITNSEFVSRLVSSKEIPKSSQPSAGVFAETYEKLGADGSKVISIHMTSGMSGTFQSALTASEMTDVEVTVVDSKFISLALGFQVQEAAKLASEGKSVAQIIKRLHEIKEATSLYIMVDTLEYLVKGGRIGRGKALVGSLMKIKPIASLQDGLYTPVSKVRTHAQMVKNLTARFEEETKGKVIKKIGIAQVEAMHLAEKLRDNLVSIHKPEEFPIVSTTPIISTHTGPGALALMYYAE